MRFMTMPEKQIFAGAIEIQKENWGGGGGGRGGGGTHAFFRDNQATYFLNAKKI